MRPTGPRSPPAVVARARQLVVKLRNSTAAALQLGLPPSTVELWTRKYGWLPRKAWLTRVQLRHQPARWRCGCDRLNQDATVCAGCGLTAPWAA
jgi:hypothetical protein